MGSCERRDAFAGKGESEVQEESPQAQVLAVLAEYPWPLEEYNGTHAPQFMAMEVEFVEMLGWLCKAFGYKRILEIGTLAGQTTWGLNRIAREVDGWVTSVDMFSVSTRAEAVKWDEYERTHFVVSDSTSFLHRALGDAVAFDLVLVDGDHTYPKALHDVEGSLAILAQGGTVAIHDSVLMPGVKETIGKLKERFPVKHWTHFEMGKGLTLLRP